MNFFLEPFEEGIVKLYYKKNVNVQISNVLQPKKKLSILCFEGILNFTGNGGVEPISDLEIINCKIIIYNKKGTLFKIMKNNSLSFKVY